MSISTIKKLLNEFTFRADDPEEIFISSGVSWQQYDALLHKLDDSPWYKVTYLDGLLELLSPNMEHEKKKENIARLLGVYFEEVRMRFYDFGSTTYRKKMNLSGIEPDVSFCIGSNKESPDLAVEIVEVSCGIDKVKVYQRLGVPEVWLFRREAFEVYSLNGQAYTKLSGSKLLSHLDLQLLATYTQKFDLLDAMTEFREKVRAQI